MNRQLLHNSLIGLGDGLTIPYALAAGLIALNVSAGHISIIGLIAAVVGSLTMGVGAFMTARKYEPQQNPYRVAFSVGSSYFIGGILSITPFVFIPNSAELLKWSALVTLPLLFLTGVVDHNIHGVNAWLGGLRLSFAGAAVATCAYFIAHLFLSA